MWPFERTKKSEPLTEKDMEPLARMTLDPEYTAGVARGMAAFSRSLHGEKEGCDDDPG